MDDNLEAELERLRAENARLKHDRGRTVSLNVSAKGGVSVMEADTRQPTMRRANTSMTNAT